jgi:hypothetical protein
MVAAAGSSVDDDGNLAHVSDEARHAAVEYDSHCAHD